VNKSFVFFFNVCTQYRAMYLAREVRKTGKRRSRGKRSQVSVPSVNTHGGWGRTQEVTGVTSHPPPRERKIILQRITHLRLHC